MPEVVTLTSRNLFGTHARPSLDRARGGKINIELTIPSETYDMIGPCGGSITTSAMKVKITIDIEELPLVNVAAYTPAKVQEAPGSIPYQDMNLNGAFG